MPRTYAYAADTDYTQGIPVLGSSLAPDAALLSAARAIAEMLRQVDSHVPGLRAAMVERRARFAVWA